jgi:hypothetical protein
MGRGGIDFLLGTTSGIRVPAFTSRGPGQIERPSPSFLGTVTHRDVIRLDNGIEIEAAITWSGRGSKRKDSPSPYADLLTVWRSTRARCSTTQENE